MAKIVLDVADHEGTVEIDGSKSRFLVEEIEVEHEAERKVSEEGWETNTPTGRFTIRLVGKKT